MNETGIGIICSGDCYLYAREVFGDGASYLKLGFTNPLPDDLIRDFASKVEKIYIIEENDPYIEEHVRALGIACDGKNIFPRNGEMKPEVIRSVIFGEETPGTMRFAQPSYRVRPRFALAARIAVSSMSLAAARTLWFLGTSVVTRLLPARRITPWRPLSAWEPASALDMGRSKSSTLSRVIRCA